MSKGKCESELERITAERDHWRKLAQQQGADIANLQRENERLNIFAKAFNLGAMQDLNKSIETLQLQRDSALADLQRVCGAMDRAYKVSIAAVQTEGERALGRIEALNETIQTNGAPQLTVLMQKAIIDHNDAWIGSIEEMRGWMAQRGIENSDPYQNPEACLTEIITLQYLAGIRSVGATFPLYAYGHSSDPRMIADEIIRECRVHGKPDIKLIQRLPIEWVKTNLPSPPGKHNTLLDGLKIHQEEIMSGKTRPAVFIAPEDEQEPEFPDV